MERVKRRVCFAYSSRGGSWPGAGLVLVWCWAGAGGLLTIFSSFGARTKVGIPKVVSRL